MDELFQLPKEILKESYLETYKNDIDSIWWEIVKLNSILFVLSKIVKFNFKLFSSHLTKDHFWQLLLQSHYESALLSLWKIQVDNSFEKGKTLSQIKNDLLANFKDENIKQLFISELKKKALAKEIQEISDKVRILRHNVVAHLNFEGIPKPNDQEQTKIKFEELQLFTEHINIFFESLCFGDQKFVVPLEYYEGKNLISKNKHKTDIEEILDTIVKESHIFDTQKNKPEVWSHLFPRLKQKDIDEINFYRNKFGLEILKA